jgi:asparagine synthase (glutamine-hydrolysing)
MTSFAKGGKTMCSISGTIDFIHSENNQQEIVQRMGKVLSHRGPDQEGVFVNDQVAFWHNRLSIMDVEKGLQPMIRTYQGSRYVIIYNGEIYNMPELRAEMEKAGVVFETTCDTEVVLYSYILYKEACAEKLNGIFAFAILDEELGRVYLARDRFGIKPLFYAKRGTTLVFASELKSLLEHPKVDPLVSQEGIWQLLYLSPNKITGKSIFKDIEEMPEGYFGIYEGGQLTLKKYWELKAKPFEGGEEEALYQTRSLLTDAITRQLVSDVPLCTFLSGGLDSSLISSVAADYYKQKGMVLSTYSFEYEGNKENFTNTLFQPQSDDLFATYLADYLGTNHKVLTVGTEDIANKLYDAAKYRDLPGMADIDSSLLYYCSKVKENHTVALSGECADEIFGGYPWFYRKEMLEKDFFPWIHDPHKRISLFNDGFTKKEEGYEFMKKIYQESIRECPILDSDNEKMRTSRIATWLSTRYFMTSLLERKDRMSMASGVEVRVPFADHRILEYVFNVPWEIKFKDEVEKSLLRNAMKEWLPDKILHRKKSPYPKTHNPLYEQMVTNMLKERLLQSDCRLKEIMDKKELENLLQTQNVTWFGQLMSKPQLIAWLIQLDYWLSNYNIQFV